jgi:hypothetical protein
VTASSDLGYGPRLTDAEYQRRIVELHSGRAEASDEADRLLRRRELELRIDYRLGRDFPSERREALWQVQERIEKRRLSLAFRHFMRQMFHRLLVHDTQRLARFAADEFGKVLSPREVERFLGLEPGETPQLPIDREARK